MTAPQPAIPGLGKVTTARPPRVHRRTLANGLRVIAVRRPTVPMVEVRLRIPAPMAGQTALARTTLLAETMLKGTAQRDGFELEQELGLLGAELNVGADRDKLMIGGSVLATSLAGYLALLADVLTSASYPKRDVQDERGRVAEHLVVAGSSAGTAAAKAIAAKMFGSHPYAHSIPEPAELLAVTAAQVRSHHRSRVLPDGAVLVLVGDLQPRRALDAVEEALGAWSGSPTQQRIPQVRFEDSPQIGVIDRPGSVQSAIRLGMPAVGRTDPAYPVQQVANMLFGGYFSSRLVRNLREDKGYTYTPRSGVDLGREASVLIVSADVSTEFTAAAVNEIRYELGRLSSTRVGDDELADARQFLVGSSLIAMSTQAGLASTCANLEVVGLDLGWLSRNLQAISGVTAEAVLELAAREITPAAARVIVVGDAEQIVGPLGTLGTVVLER
ncbi:pitrilysin family protein [Blastococcus sp. Marseille-P5729]|uniref:M16 family metallopeptidase n=1 Tax=Blastococcus sp. Marseille-P5729 TaxID=2086582 RepID=UPI000D0E7399|nr:pitrilysin family protein [Blastococcus sp. Marseille-P5729]